MQFAGGPHNIVTRRDYLDIEIGKIIVKFAAHGEHLAVPSAIVAVIGYPGEEIGKKEGAVVNRAFFPAAVAHKVITPAHLDRDAAFWRDGSRQNDPVNGAAR